VAKDTNFKFGTHAPRKSLDMTPEFFFRKHAFLFNIVDMSLYVYSWCFSSKSVLCHLSTQIL